MWLPQHFLWGPFNSTLQKGKKSGEPADLLWDPGRVAFSLWFPVFSLLCPCVSLKGPSPLPPRSPMHTHRLRSLRAPQPLPRDEGVGAGGTERGEPRPELALPRGRLPRAWAPASSGRALLTGPCACSSRGEDKSHHPSLMPTPPCPRSTPFPSSSVEVAN